MDQLKELAHISGKPGLYKILKPTRTGVIVEAMDAKKEKMVVGSHTKVSVLSEISIFMQDHQDNAKPLAEIMQSIKTKYPEGLPSPVKELSEQKLIELFLDIEPDFDRERVYPSDIKKVLNWYQLILTQLPEAFVIEQAATVETTADTEEKPAKKSKKK